MGRLVLFAKRPRAGHVKTRLVPPLTPEQALELYRAFLSDQLRFLLSFAGEHELELCRDEAWEAAVDPRVRLTLQGAGDLGERMGRCFERSFDEGATAVAILGADCPTVPATAVRRAFDELARGATAAVAPATDGGYVLLALSRAVPALFRDVPWGRERVLRTTLERAGQAGIRLALVDPWYDVDESADLVRLRRELGSAPGAARAPASARALARLRAALDGGREGVI